MAVLLVVVIVILSSGDRHEDGSDDKESEVANVSEGDDPTITTITNRPGGPARQQVPAPVQLDLPIVESPKLPQPESVELPFDPVAEVVVAADGSGDHTDLVDALRACRPYSRIRIRPGTYYARARSYPSGFPVREPVIIEGDGPPERIVIKGGTPGQQGQCLHFEESLGDKPVLVRGLTFHEPEPIRDFSQPCLRGEGGTVTIDNCRFAALRACENRGNTITFANCEFDAEGCAVPETVTVNASVLLSDYYGTTRVRNCAFRNGAIGISVLTGTAEVKTSRFEQFSSFAINVSADEPGTAATIEECFFYKVRVAVMGTPGAVVDVKRAFANYIGKYAFTCAGAKMDLQHVVVQGGAAAVTAIHGSSVTIRDCRLNSGRDGVVVKGGSLEMRDTEVDAKFALVGDGDVELDVERSRFEGSGAGVVAFRATGSVKGCRITGIEGGGVQVPPDAKRPGPTFSACTIVGKRSSAVRRDDRSVSSFEDCRFESRGQIHIEPDLAPGR